MAGAARAAYIGTMAEEIKLTDEQKRLLDVLQETSVMKGSDLARYAGYKELAKLAADIKPLIEARLVQATGPTEGDDIFYAVFAIRPSDMETVRDVVRRARR